MKIKIKNYMNKDIIFLLQKNICNDIINIIDEYCKQIYSLVKIHILDEPVLSKEFRKFLRNLGQDSLILSTNIYDLANSEAITAKRPG